MNADPVTECLALYAIDQFGKKRPQMVQWSKSLPNKAPLIAWYEGRK